MNKNQPVVIMVDPTDYGLTLIPPLREKGFEIVGLFPFKEQVWEEQFALENRVSIPYLELRSHFDEWIFERQFSELIADLYRYRNSISAIIPSSAKGGYLADKIAGYFDVPRNEPTLINARKDTKIMKVAVRDEDIQIADTKRIYSLKELTSQIKTRSYPVKLQTPPDSLHPVNLQCENFESLINSYNLIKHTPESFNPAPSYVLLEPCTSGDTYMAYVFGDGKQSHTLSIWKYDHSDRDCQKTDSNVLRLIQGTPEFQALQSKAELLTDVLGITIGLVEVCFQINGEQIQVINVALGASIYKLPEILSEISNFDLRTALADVYTEGETRKAETFSLNKEAALVICKPKTTARVSSIEGTDTVRALNSHVNSSLIIDLKNQLFNEQALSKYPLLTWLIHKDKAQINSDIDCVLSSFSFQESRSREKERSN